MPGDEQRGSRRAVNSHGDRPVVVVTGAGAGLGRALCDAFVRADYRVVGLGHREQSLRDTAVSIGSDQFSWIVADVANPDAVDSAFTAIMDDCGRIDVLFNNAAIYPREAFHCSDMRQWVRTIEVNLFGAAYCCKAVLPSMMARNRGRIFNVGSFADGAPIALSSAYSVSKGALHPLAKAIVADLDQTDLDIQVHEWVPGHLKTRMSDFTGADPEVAAAWALAIVKADNASTRSTLYVNDHEYAPPRSMCQRLVDLIRLRFRR